MYWAMTAALWAEQQEGVVNAEAAWKQNFVTSAVQNYWMWKMFHFEWDIPNVLYI